jgi:hypothetical protein
MGDFFIERLPHDLARGGVHSEQRLPGAAATHEKQATFQQRRGGVLPLNVASFVIRLEIDGPLGLTAGNVKGAQSQLGGEHKNAVPQNDRSRAGAVPALVVGGAIVPALVVLGDAEGSRPQILPARGVLYGQKLLGSTVQLLERKSEGPASGHTVGAESADARGLPNRLKTGGVPLEGFGRHAVAGGAAILGPVGCLQNKWAGED